MILIEDHRGEPATPLSENSEQVAIGLTVYQEHARYYATPVIWPSD
jgi:hypothetical protein